jgi:hypothetical protein
MSQELKPKRTIPPERLAVLAKWGGNPHEEEVYWMAEELQRARAQLATHSNAHLLRSHEATEENLRKLLQVAEYSLRVGYGADDCGDHCSNSCHWCDLRNTIKDIRGAK